MAWGAIVGGIIGAVAGGLVSDKGYSRGLDDKRKGLRDMKAESERALKIIDDVFAEVIERHGPEWEGARKTYQQIGADIKSGAYSSEAFMDVFIDAEGFNPPEQYKSQFREDDEGFAFDPEQDSSYKFRVEQGKKAIAAKANAAGGAYSGALGKALVGYGQQMASQEYAAQHGRYTQDRGIQQADEGLRQSDVGLALNDDYRNRQLRLEAGNTLFQQRESVSRLGAETSLAYTQQGIGALNDITQSQLKTAELSASVLDRKGNRILQGQTELGDTQINRGNDRERSIDKVSSFIPLLGGS